jgi:sec-independent protein translocase protein TatC
LFSGRFPFSEHIAELRKRLRVVALTFLVILVVLVLFPSNPQSSVQNPGQYLNLSFIYNTVIASFLGHVVHDLLPANWHLIAAAGIGEGMEVYFVAALILAVAIDMPVMAYETYRFIDPALNERERKLIYPFVVSTSLLFLAGLLFGYFVLAKFLIIALSPFFVATGISFQVDAAAFYYVIFLIIGATGVAFTSPVFVYALIRLRVLSADLFSKNRVIIWFLIWVVTGLFLTPDGGPLLDLVIFVPIVAMVEAAVFLARRGVAHEDGNSPPPPKPKGGFTCPHCGYQMESPRLFCDRCGKSIA